MIIADDADFRAVLARSLGRRPEFEVVGQASTISGAALQLVSSHPHIVVLDPTFSDGSAGDAVKHIRSRCPDASLILVAASAQDVVETMTSALVDGFIDRSSPVCWVITAVRGLVGDLGGSSGLSPNGA